MQGHKSLHHMLRAIHAPRTLSVSIVLFPTRKENVLFGGETKKMNEKILLLNPLNVTGQKEEKKQRGKDEGEKGTTKTEVRMLFLVWQFDQPRDIPENGIGIV